MGEELLEERRMSRGMDREVLNIEGTRHGKP